MPSNQLNSLIQNEASRLAEHYKIDSEALLEFAQFVIVNYKKKDKAVKKVTKKIKPLSMADLKKAVYSYFEVKDTTELKKSGSFKMATDGMEPMNLGLKDSWEVLYRKFIGVLPGEDQEEGYGCINGIDIFKYFLPWRVFDLNPKSASKEDIKKAYHALSKTYHPDTSGTGDTKVFDRINTMYQSIGAEA
ncbi:DnaJ domain-containing protein [Nodosilinea sp. FACHB-131]|uniref:J domain-containing protein n=1 Tax=Cyanophyceae TaxID=3028117 RepID=UPI0016864BBA|nr:DnaJ domain-containing protein [Nodosilinea sp. FACHB-131]MBD1875335.1 DnaJ domain-containing protein [Nodosilinea sp. FACHB-131]